MKSIAFTKVEDINGKQRLQIRVNQKEGQRDFSESLLISFDCNFENKSETAEHLDTLIRTVILPELALYGDPGPSCKLLFNQQVSGSVEMVYSAPSEPTGKRKIIGLKKPILKLELSEEEIRFIFKCFNPYIVS